MNKKHIAKHIGRPYNGRYRRWYSLINRIKAKGGIQDHFYFFRVKGARCLSVKVDQSSPRDLGKFNVTCKQPLRKMPSSFPSDPAVCHKHFLMAGPGGKSKTDIYHDLRRKE